MPDIRAFVGHSFLEADAAVVEKFLRYFDTVAKLYPHFSWEHAEAAEPKQLAEKVLSLIKDKNTFIGICTQREKAIEPGLLSSKNYWWGYAKAKEADFEWKTSDWIIQEIGMAVGRGLEVILFLENDVRRPGGLQGDIEFINFNRDAPERSFKKFLEMIIALSPKSASSETAQADLSATEQSDATAESKQDDSWTMPSADWTREQYERAMLIMVARKDIEGEQRIDTSYLATEDAERNDNRKSWLARNEWLRIAFGETGNLKKIRELSSENASSYKIKEYLARGLDKYGEYSDAAKIYDAAASLAQEAGEKIRLLGRAAIQFIKAGQSARVFEFTTKAEDIFAENPDSEEQYLTTLRAIYEELKNEDLQVIVLDRLCALNPDEAETCFSLAYKHSQIGNNDLALTSYLRTPFQNRSSVAWNNLGVAYDRFQMRAKAVEAFRTAEEMGETLAMSNLGYRLANVGMTTEAQLECDKAMRKEDYHKNIADLNVRLRAIPDEENKKLDEVLERAKPKADFYKALGHAILRKNATSIDGDWSGPKCPLKVLSIGSSVTMTGAYEVEENPLGGILGSFGKIKVRHSVEYMGESRGSLIDGSLSQRREGGTPGFAASILGIGDSTKVLMYIQSSSEIKVMENPYSVSPTFYSLTKVR